MRCYTALEYQPQAGRELQLNVRLAAWAILLLAALFLLTTGGTYPGIASVEAHVIGQVVAYVVLGGWLALALVSPTWRPRTSLVLPVLLACLAYVLSALASQRPRLSFEPTIAGLGWAFALLFLGRLFADPWFRARAAVLMTAFVAIVAFGYLVQVGIEWVNWWSLIGGLAVPPLRPSFAGLWLGSPNLVATALILLAPLVVTIVWTRYRHPRVGLAIALATGLALFLSGSRGAWLGAVAGVVVGLGLAAIRGSVRSPIRRVVAAFRARRILVVPAVVVIGALVLLAPSVILRFAQGGATVRLDLWRSALSIFAEHPLTGTGPGTWVQLKVEANPAGVPNLIFPHAHDLYVQAAAEIGTVGLVALTVLAAAVLRRLWSAWQAPPRTDLSVGRSLSLEAAAVIVSLAALAGQSVVDNLVNLPFVCLLVLAIVAWVDGRLAESVPVAPARAQGVVSRVDALARGPLTAVVGLFVLAALLPFLLRIDRAASLMQAGNDAALRGDWELALDAYNSARAEDPGFTLYEIQTATALARVGRTDDARDLLAVAVENDPVAINLIGLSALEAELGQREAALAHLAKARAVGVRESAVALNAGLIAERLGERDLALDAFADAIAWNAPLARSDIWASTFRIVSKESVVALARERVDDPVDAAVILAYAGYPTAARAELDGLPGSSRRDVYIAATEWLAGDTSAAIVRLEAMLAEEPHDWFAAAWAARIARISEDAPASSRYSRWAIAIQGDSAPGVIGERSIVPASGDAATANLPSNYPWAMYLRPIAPYLLVPQLVLIGAT